MAEPAKFEAPDGYDKLEAMANALDEGGTPEISSEPDPTPPEVEPKAEITPDPDVKLEAEAKPEAKESRERRKDGTFLPKKTEPKQEAKPDVKVEPDKPTDSAYEKAKKEEARQKSVLANFESEKKQAREELAQREAQLQQRERQIQQASAQQRPEATLHGHTAKEYWDAAQAFRKEGDHENALKCMDAVGQIRTFEGQYHQQAQAQSYDAQFRADMEKTIEEHQELKDQESPQSKAMSKILELWPEVYYLKGGFNRAFQAAQWLLDSESKAELQQKVTSLETEVATFRGKTQPAAGGPTSPARPKNVLDMNPADAERHLQRLADDADSMAV